MDVIGDATFPSTRRRSLCVFKEVYSTLCCLRTIFLEKSGLCCTAGSSSLTCAALYVFGYGHLSEGEW
jgi:hypothetical protein